MHRAFLCFVFKIYGGVNMRKIVTDHIISPDREFMWTGSKWIPASTPATETTSSAGMSLQDSAIEGSINIT